MYLTEIFTRKELEYKTKQLLSSLSDDYSEKFEELFGMSEQLAFGSECTGKSWKILVDYYYHNEYFVKQNAIRELGPELRFEYVINKNIADIISLDRLEAYEIKTKYDTTKRLLNQVNGYSEVFKYVNVICSRTKLASVKNLVPEWCGIITYSERVKPRSDNYLDGVVCPFVTVRKPKLSPNFDIAKLIELFTQAEIKKMFKKCVHKGVVKKEEIINLYTENEIIDNHLYWVKNVKE